MPREIDGCSYVCDCGYQLDFCENTIREMKEGTRRKRGGISEGEDNHAAFFHRGRFVAMYCPKVKGEIPVAGAEEAGREDRATGAARRGRAEGAGGQVDWEKVDEVVLALLSLTLHEETPYGGRAWKGHSWEVLDRLHAKGWIGNPVGKTKSVVLGPEDMARARAMFAKWFESFYPMTGFCL